MIDFPLLLTETIDLRVIASAATRDAVLIGVALLLILVLLPAALGAAGQPVPIPG